jgi:hypothetical protein
MAEALIEALNPILDLLASEPSKPKKFCWTPADRKLEENRWALWRAVSIAHEAVCYQGGTQAWRESPIRRRFERELSTSLVFIGGEWWNLRCGRPTKKGEPCKAPLSKGRAHYWRHSTLEENEELRLWQDRIHLPYPRVDVGKSLIDRESLISGLEALREAMAS